MPSPEDRPPATPRQLDPKVLGAALALGIACLLVAVTGGPVTALGFGLPGVESPLIRGVLGVVGGLLVLASTLIWLRGNQPGRPPDQAGGELGPRLGIRWPWGSVRGRPVLALAGAIVAAAGGLLVVVLVVSRGGEQGPKCLEDGTEGTQRFAISIGDQVVADQRCAGIGNIEASGATDVYTFTAMAGQVVYVDDQSTCGEKVRSMAWTVIGSDEQSVFDESRVCGDDVGGLTLERGGSYTLTVTSDITGGYRFRLWDAPQERFSVKVGERVGGSRSDGAGNIETPGTSDTYTFTATAGQSVYVDDQTTCGDSSRWLTWTIVGSDRQAVFDQPEVCGSDVGGLVLERGGSYSVTVKGQEDTTGTYQFQLWDASQQRFSVKVGERVGAARSDGAGNIETPGAADIYRFSATAGQVVYIDDQTDCDKSNWLTWTIVGTDERPVFDNAEVCGSDAGGLALERGGSYSLTVKGQEDTTGTYSFRLWNAPQQRFRIRIGAQVQPGRPSRGAGNIETPGTADTYLFAATAGQVVYVDDQSACDTSFRSLVWTITGPDDQEVFDASRICGSDVGGLVLEQGGTYRLTVTGSEDSVATYRFQLRGG